MSASPPQSISERTRGHSREGATVQRSSTMPAYGGLLQRSPPPVYTAVPFIGRRHATSPTPLASVLPPLQGSQSPRARMSSATGPTPPFDIHLAEFREVLPQNTTPPDSQAQTIPLTHRHRHEMARPQSLVARTPDDYRSSAPSSVRRFPSEPTRGAQGRSVSAQVEAELRASPRQSPSVQSGIASPPLPERQNSGLEEEPPPSPGSIASTAISPSLLRKREELEKELIEMAQDVKRDNGSLRSRKTPSPSLPAYSSPKNASRSTLTARDASRASQHLAAPPDPPRTTTPLSYASHNRYMDEPADSNADLPQSRPPSSLPVRQYHETPTNTMHHSSPPNTQTLPLPNELTPPLSSNLGSPQRSIPSHDSPSNSIIADHTELEGGRTGTGPDTILVFPPSPQKVLRRRDRESISHPAQNTVKKRNSDLTPAKLGSGVIMLSGASPDGWGYYTESTVSSGISQPAQAFLVPAAPSPVSLRTLDSVRSQVASEIAYRAISKAKIADGVRTGIADASSASGPDDLPFVHQIALSLTSSFTLSSTPYLFLVTTTATPTIPGILFITSSSRDIASRAVQLCSSKFIGRLSEGSFSPSRADPEDSDGSMIASGTEYLAQIKNLNISSFDFDILLFVLLSASRTPLDPKSPPPGSKSISTILSEVRAQLQRVTPRQAITELRDNLMDVPVVLVDIRPQAQRDEFGSIRGALVIERNVLEWRFDPRCDARLPIADRYDLRIIVFCQEGYTSSLAAFALHQLGLLNATDMIGGYQAWKDAKLPVELRPERSIASLAGSIV